MRRRSGPTRLDVTYTDPLTSVTPSQFNGGVDPWDIDIAFPTNMQPLPYPSDGSPTPDAHLGVVEYPTAVPLGAPLNFLDDLYPTQLWTRLERGTGVCRSDAHPWNPGQVPGIPPKPPNDDW